MMKKKIASLREEFIDLDGDNNFDTSMNKIAESDPGRNQDSSLDTLYIDITCPCFF